MFISFLFSLANQSSVIHKSLASITYLANSIFTEGLFVSWNWVEKILFTLTYSCGVGSICSVFACSGWKIIIMTRASHKKDTIFTHAVLALDKPKTVWKFAHVGTPQGRSVMIAAFWIWGVLPNGPIKSNVIGKKRRGLSNIMSSSSYLNDTRQTRLVPNKIRMILKLLANSIPRL